MVIYSTVEHGLFIFTLEVKLKRILLQIHYELYTAYAPIANVSTNTLTQLAVRWSLKIYIHCKSYPYNYTINNQ